MMSNNFDKSAILESFLDEVTSYLPEIEANLDRLQQRPDEFETIEETYRRAHTIAGSAAMMDFGGLARVAQGMEDILGEAIDRSASLDVPTVGLLRRSATRLKRLIDYIRQGGDETPVVQEDDADRAAWRGAGSAMPAGAAAQDGADSRPGAGAMPAPHASASGSFPAAGPANPAGQGGSTPLQIPDWLAAFAPAMGQQPPADTPSGPTNGLAGQGVQPPTFPGATLPEWATGGAAFAPSGPAESGHRSGPRPRPETDAPLGDPWGESLTHVPTGRMPAFPPPQAPGGGPWERPQAPPVGGAMSAPPSYQADGQTESFEDILRAFQANGVDARQQVVDPAPAAANDGRFPAGAPWAAPGPFDVSDARTGAMPAVSPSPSTGALSAPAAATGPVVEELRADEEAVRRHVATLRSVVASLRDTAQAMEDERGELRTFLDGSRDALDRLEDWAGQQMGLDLKHSPDSVRRYLPLSVIWVTSTRLKRLVALLNGSGRTLTATQEQIDEALDHLRATLAGAGGMLGAMASLPTPPDTGFTATVAQFSWAPPAPAPQDAAALHPQPAALSPGTRAEIERETREHLRRELEDEVRAEVAAEVRRDEEQRLRQELQIQVRRELLSELTPAVASGAFAASTGPMPVQMPFMGDRPPKAVRVTSEQSPEALEVFREEAQEHLLAITTGIAELEAHPGDGNTLRSIRRAVHTLKGAAGMMGFTAVQQISHASEDLLDRLVDSQQMLSPDLVGLLLDTSDTLDQLVRGMLGPDDEAAAQRRLIARYAAVTGGAVAADTAAVPGAEAVAIDMAEAAEEAPRPAEDGGDLSVRLQLSKLDDLVNLFGELLVSRSILEERLERLGRMVGDASVVGERLRDVGSQLETRFEAATLPSGRQGPTQNGGGQQAGHRWGLPGLRSGGNRQQQGAFANEFDELELDRYTEFHRLSRGLSEGVSDIVTLTHEMEAIVRESQASFSRESRLSSDFQDRLLKARLVPLQSLMPRLYRTVRTSAAREGKEVEFYAEGADTEVDRKVFEEVTGPLLHLVRNSVNHGLESPAAREAAGKPRAGRVTVSATYEGNQVVIAVRDDGAGIDPEAIRQTAVARGWIDAYTHLSEKEAINLIFKQGMSTAKAVTEESGRGVGLDVVRDAVTRLRGTIEVESTVGQGTVFTMKFPISLQIARAVLVKVGSQTFAVPMAVVDQIGRLDYYQRSPGQVPAVEMRGERYTLAHLGQFLGVQHGAAEERSAVLLVTAGKRRVALLADAIVAQQEIVSKPLGPHLRDVPGVAGAAVLGNGQVVLILELHELLARDPRGELVLPQPGSRSSSPAASPAAAQVSLAETAPTPAYLAAPRQPAATPPAPAGQREFVVTRPAATPAKVTLPPASHTGHLLVVDDSPSVRRVVSNMLKSHGWEVQTARDGVEALEAVARSVPAAVLLDIEMPRMDGYELMATIRSQEQYRHLPLIVLTSRAATKHQQRAIQLGADAYVVKPYQDEELLLTIEGLVQARRS